MTKTADPLVLDFVEWIAREPRAYSEVIGDLEDLMPAADDLGGCRRAGYVARETDPGLRPRRDGDGRRRKAAARAWPRELTADHIALHSR